MAQADILVSLLLWHFWPQVVDAVNIPVIGAGGIGDGRGMAAVFNVGADAVHPWNSFLVAIECTAHTTSKLLY